MKSVARKLFEAESFCNNLVKIQKLIFMVDQTINELKLGVILHVVLFLGILFGGVIKRLEVICFFLVMYLLLVYLQAIKKFYISVRKFFITVIFTNAILCTYVALIVNNVLNFCSMEDNTLLLISFVVYLIVWIYISLVAKSEVAKLVNEIVSVMTTILFTAGTYIISIKYSTTPSLEALELTYNNIEELERELAANSNLLVDSVIKSFGEVLFMLLLPFLSVSLFCTLLVDIKDYCLKKCGKKEFWDSDYLKILEEVELLNEPNDECTRTP